MAIAATACMFMLPAIPQDPAYHRFADTREYFSIPNFLNVISNLSFPFIAIPALLLLMKRKKQNAFFAQELCFFLGILLTGIGSAYYHYAPDNNTLVWDRFPMTIAFMSLFSVVISECIHAATGKTLLPHLIFTGIFSVIYWNYTEAKGHGDLRFYALVQFLPILLIALILILFRQNKSVLKYYGVIGSCYLLAKVFEGFDQQIFSMGHFISGHSLKHLFAALVPLIVYSRIKRRVSNSELS